MASGPKTILLAAFACDPSQGSEFGLGWRWALEGARLGHRMHVLTDSRTRDSVRAALARLDDGLALEVHFVDLPEAMIAVDRWLAPHGLPSQIWAHLLHIAWQRAAYRYARRHLGNTRFDAVHHITYATLRTVSWLGAIPAGFMIGPLGGGEKVPLALRRGIGLRGWLVDLVRDLANLVLRIDPLVGRTFRSADTIFVANVETLMAVPRRFRHKARLAMQCGVDQPDPPQQRPARPPDGFRVIYIGRFVYAKGMHLGLRAFAKFLTRAPAARLQMVGRGPEERHWRGLAARLGIEHAIEWTPWVARAEVAAIYANNDVLLFPSLQESVGNVVLEALSHGLPAICLNLGGPPIVVDEHCARVVEVRGRTADQVVHDLADAMHALATDAAELARMSVAARQRSRELSWAAVVAALYGDARAAPAT